MDVTGKLVAPSVAGPKPDKHVEAVESICSTGENHPAAPPIFVGGRRKTVVRLKERNSGVVKTTTLCRRSFSVKQCSKCNNNRKDRCSV